MFDNLKSWVRKVLLGRHYDLTLDKTEAYAKAVNGELFNFLRKKEVRQELVKFVEANESSLKKVFEGFNLIGEALESINEESVVGVKSVVATSFRETDVKVNNLAEDFSNEVGDIIESFEEEQEVLTHG